MAVYFAVGTPADDGRVQDFRLVPPPDPQMPFPVLVWDNDVKEPVWRSFSELATDLPINNTYVPLTTDAGEWLVTDLGERLVANYQ